MSRFIIPTIETERLILRPLTVEDAGEAFEWTGDERVSKYMIYTTHSDISVTKTWLESTADLENEYLWGFVRKSDGKLIGSGSIRYRTDEERWSFGYNIRYDCWNQGYTTEATLRMMDYVREKHGAKRFVAEHAVGNPASGRVMEKCGLHCVGECEYTRLDGTPVKGIEYELNEGEE
ncbi:MAG: GNAT family N-acetyltransferase [Ruminococcus sp.]|nr:GNAT family N-acetyltransferase [Ruminococcus sp.]